MTRKQRRLAVIAGLGAVVMVAVLFIAWGFQSTFSFFATPSQIAALELDAGRPFRLGGLVKDGSWVRDGQTSRFTVTDGLDEVEVTYVGLLPDLFREGQGVIAEGALGAGGVFAATTVLARHDETYMPREVREELERIGEWRPEYGAGEE